jgi:hypothetical protein
LDEYLVGLCAKYGVTYRDRCAVRRFDAGSVGGGARLAVRRGGASGVETVVEAALVVDCTGHAAFGAHHAGLLSSAGAAATGSHAACDLLTRTRVTYGHFAYTDAFDLDAACGGASNAFRYRRDSGTIHHVLIYLIYRRSRRSLISSFSIR